jgi:hypothetical protein
VEEKYTLDCIPLSYPPLLNLRCAEDRDLLHAAHFLLGESAPTGAASPWRQKVQSMHLNGRVARCAYVKDVLYCFIGSFDLPDGLRRLLPSTNGRAPDGAGDRTGAAHTHRSQKG